MGRGKYIDMHLVSKIHTHTQSLFKFSGFCFRAGDGTQGTLDTCSLWCSHSPFILRQHLTKLSMFESNVLCSPGRLYPCDPPPSAEVPWSSALPGAPLVLSAEKRKCPDGPFCTVRGCSWCTRLKLLAKRMPTTSFQRVARSFWAPAS